MSDKRQKNQLGWPLARRGGVKLQGLLGEGTETPTAKRMSESPAGNDEQLMEEVCERENCLQALKRVKSNKGSRGHRRHDGRGVARLPEGALASHPRTTVERDLQAATGEEGRDTQAGRRGATVGHPDGAGPHGAAGGDAGAATQVGRGIFRTQSRVSARTLGASGGSQGAAVYRRRPPLGGGSRLWRSSSTGSIMTG